MRRVLVSSVNRRNFKVFDAFFMSFIYSKKRHGKCICYLLVNVTCSYIVINWPKGLNVLTISYEHKSFSFGQNINTVLLIEERIVITEFIGGLTLTPWEPCVISTYLKILMKTFVPLTC